MATISNAGGPIDNVRATFEAMSDEELIATDLVQRGAIDALATLLRLGATRTMAEEMHTSARFGRGLLACVAFERGVKLVNEE